MGLVHSVSENLRHSAKSVDEFFLLTVQPIKTAAGPCESGHGFKSSLPPIATVESLREERRSGSAKHGRSRTLILAFWVGTSDGITGERNGSDIVLGLNAHYIGRIARRVWRNFRFFSAAPPVRSATRH